MNFYARFGKRLLDLALSTVILLVLSPFIAILALRVARQLGRPIFFRQYRPGLNEELFLMTKFRSMTDEKDDKQQLLSDSKRLTDFGRFLRRTSLDELPELFNVVKGEMSLVGPRPLLPRYSAYFTNEERVRFKVRPGITGLAQVAGRNDLNWDRRLAADVRYVEQLSFVLDCKILYWTLKAVLTRSGVREDPGSFMLDLDAERSLRKADSLAN